MTEILAIDPGPKESAFVVWDGASVYEFGKIDNYSMFDVIEEYGKNTVLEMISSYGMAVGKDVFETVFWIGRFYQTNPMRRDRLYRKDVKMHLCHSMKAKDSNIITALIDRFDPKREYGQYGKGTKKKPGPFYGFSKDIWQAFALAVTWWDLNNGKA